jgi:hypothetical protein
MFSGENTFPGKENHTQSYDFLIISPALFLDELQPLQDHKQHYGIETKIITIEEINDETYFQKQGRDSQEQIKYFLKQAYDTWNVSYVLFVGGQALLPLRRIETIPFEEIPVNFTSELYYADLYDSNNTFSTWDADQDGIYGEWYNNSSAEDYQQDFIPEIGLGRLPCYQKEEVQHLVSKIIKYESQPADPCWFQTMVVAAGETFVEFPGLEGEQMTQNALDVMSDFTPVKLWYSNGKLDKLGISILRAINQGCGFLYFAGHGNSHVWTAFNPQGKAETLFSIFHVPFLMNRNEYPVCILSGCHVCKIEKSFCLGWQLVRYQHKGSIATIGPTNIGYMGFEYNGGGLDWLELQFFKEYMNGTTIIGDIWKQSLSSFAETFPIDWNTPAGPNCSLDAKMAQEWMILGDPTRRIGGYS